MTKEEKIKNYLCSKGLSDEEIKSDTTGLRRITKEIILEAINWACSNLKEEQNKNNLLTQMIYDSQECHDEDIRESSFEVMLEDDLPTETEIKEHLYHINYTTTPESENSKYEWICNKCGRKYYKFPTSGCLCGTKETNNFYRNCK